MTINDYFEKLTTKINPADLEGVSTKINFDLKGKEMHLVVKDGTLTANEGLADEAEVSITAKEEDLLSIINGDTNPMMAMMMGKIKISNPAAMMKYAKLLGLM
ncbi:MAG: SCP2 sterol-binding domain-containing protein [Leadbetterella sp.]|jgi:putative sterol carrier protein|nr:SCP2 sterol-binding domain-containing protein [Leadbetterella sp.]